MASKRNGTLYVGATSDPKARAWQHKNEYYDGFSKKYGTKILVWYEVHGNIYYAIEREKQIKKWRRNWKKDLVESMNPQWEDLWDEIIQ
ncbi:MAG: GIY-YIG nuclease family protein [Rickettsiales bacterium]|nr:GIY-YIG nuclease family protein [Rickettsiales bacterium]